MQYHYTKIDDLMFNDKQLHFRTPLTKQFTRATAFSEKYLYYHSPVSILHTSEINPLGKFVKVSRQSSGSMYDDYDYSVYEFELGTVKCKRDGRTEGDIYLVGIPDSNEGMTLVDNMKYRGWPVFYIKE
jgi:hypothetical protein